MSGTQHYYTNMLEVTIGLGQKTCRGHHFFPQLPHSFLLASHNLEILPSLTCPCETLFLGYLFLRCFIFFEAILPYKQILEGPHTLLYYITYCQPLSAIQSVTLWWEKHVLKATKNNNPENKKQLEDRGLRMPDMDWDIKETAALQKNQSCIIFQGCALVQVLK